MLWPNSSQTLYGRQSPAAWQTNQIFSCWRAMQRTLQPLDSGSSFPFGSWDWTTNDGSLLKKIARFSQTPFACMYHNPSLDPAYWAKLEPSTELSSRFTLFAGTFFRVFRGVLVQLWLRFDDIRCFCGSFDCSSRYAWPSSTYPQLRIPAFLLMVIRLVCVCVLGKNIPL